MQYPTHKQHVDAAYAKYHDRTYSQFIAALPECERVAVLISNLNEQVVGSGFHAWVQHGFITGKDSLVETLEELYAFSREPELYDVLRLVLEVCATPDSPLDELTETYVGRSKTVMQVTEDYLQALCSCPKETERVPRIIDVYQDTITRLRALPRNG